MATAIPRDRRLARGARGARPTRTQLGSWPARATPQLRGLRDAILDLRRSLGVRFQRGHAQLKPAELHHLVESRGLRRPALRSCMKFGRTLVVLFLAARPRFLQLAILKSRLWPILFEDRKGEGPLASHGCRASPGDCLRGRHADRQTTAALSPNGYAHLCHPASPFFSDPHGRAHCAERTSTSTRDKL